MSRYYSYLIAAMNIGYFVVLIFHLFVYQIPAFLVGLLEYPLKLIFGKFFRFNLSNYLVRLGFLLTNKTFFGTNYIVDETIDLGKRYIYMPNHQSFADSIIGGIINNKTFILVIGYTKYIPLLGFNAVLSGSPFAPYITKEERKRMDSERREREKQRKQPSFQNNPSGVTNKIINVLTNDQEASFTIFPEGRRLFDDNICIDNIRTGGFVAAIQLNIDIVPIYHNCMSRFNDQKKEYYWDKKVYCILRKPIKVKVNGKDKTVEQLKKEYFDAMQTLRKQYLKLIEQDKKHKMRE